MIDNPYGLDTQVGLDDTTRRVSLMSLPVLLEGHCPDLEGLPEVMERIPKVA